jgi:hypothetical protein
MNDTPAPRWDHEYRPFVANHFPQSPAPPPRHIYPAMKAEVPVTIPAATSALTNDRQLEGKPHWSYWHARRHRREEARAAAAEEADLKAVSSDISPDLGAEMRSAMMALWDERKKAVVQAKDTAKTTSKVRTES